MDKEQTIRHWENLIPAEEVRPNAIPYSHTGSTYTCDSLRVTGSMEFIDSVLSRVKDILAYENENTRLHISCRETVDRDTGLDTGKFNCYVQVRERGRVASNYTRALRQEPEVKIDLKPMQDHKSLRELANSFL
jgi:hypothetical protein